jgi:hypothetical protein
MRLGLRGGSRIATGAVGAKCQKLVVNFGRESAASSTSIDDEFIQVLIQPDVVPP